MIDDDRAVRGLMDVVAVEAVAPGMVKIVTWSDAYVVDARGQGCECPDKEYNLGPGEKCKHHAAAFLATSDYPAPWDVEDDLGTRADPVAMTDGGNRPEGHDQFTVADPERKNAYHFDSRSAAQERMQKARELGIEPELHEPGDSPEFLYHAEETNVSEQAENETEDVEEPPETDGGNAEVIDVTPADAEPAPADAEEAAELPERSVADDPLTWMPSDFVDQIDGTPAVNRKGFEVLSHFYDISVSADLQVAPDENGHEYARVKATATTADGRTCEAFGSAHVDRGDDKTLLLEMADTRARKRALSIATGVGAVAVEELKNEVPQ